MFTKQGGIVVGGPNASGDILDAIGVYPLALNANIQLGQPLCRDTSQLVNSSEPGTLASAPYNVGPASTFTNQGDIVTLPNATNAADLFGIYQGPLFLNTVGTNLAGTATFQFAAKCRKKGIGWVLAGAVAGGTAVTIGAKLIINTTNNFAVVGARAIGTAVGVVVAYPINTTLTAAVASGAQTVTVASLNGITTATPITVDSGALQETVTPSAVAQGVVASGTLTVASAGTVTTLTATIGGGASGFPQIVASYTTTAADTATTAALALGNAINAAAAALGASNYLQPVTLAAGVITVRALNPGLAQNAIGLVAAVTGGSVTLTAGAATLASGTNSTITATFAFAHASGAAVQGICSISGTSVLAVPSGGALIAPVLVDISVV